MWEILLRGVAAAVIVVSLIMLGSLPTQRSLANLLLTRARHIMTGSARRTGWVVMWKFALNKMNFFRKMLGFPEIKKKKRRGKPMGM